MEEERRVDCLLSHPILRPRWDTSGHAAGSSKENSSPRRKVPAILSICIPQRSAGTQAFLEVKQMLKFSPSCPAGQVAQVEVPIFFSRQSPVSVVFGRIRGHVRQLNSTRRAGFWSAAAISSADWHSASAASRVAVNSSSCELATILLGADKIKSPVCSPLTSASTTTPEGAGSKGYPHDHRIDDATGSRKYPVRKKVELVALGAACFYPNVGDPAANLVV